MNSYRKTGRLTGIGYLLAVGLLLVFAVSACSNSQENAAQVDPKVSQVENQAISEQMAVQAQVEQPQPATFDNPVEPVQKEAGAEAALPAAPPAQEASASEQVVQSTQVAPAAEPVAATAPAASPTEAPAALAQAAPVAADPQIETKPEIGFLAPDFNLATLDGQSVRLEDLRGRPVVISYWATWCVPCKKELPILEQLSQEYASTGIQIITIDAIEQDNLDNVHGLVGELGLTLPVLLDQQNQFQSSYKQLFFPTSYFIDANGVIRWIKLGDAPEALLRENVEKLINNQL